MSKVSIAPLTELPEGRGVRVEVGDHRVAVFRIGDSVYAIGDLIGPPQLAHAATAEAIAAVDGMAGRASRPVAGPVIPATEPVTPRRPE